MSAHQILGLVKVLYETWFSSHVFSSEGYVRRVGSLAILIADGILPVALELRKTFGSPKDGFISKLSSLKNPLKIRSNSLDLGGGALNFATLPK